MNFRRFLRDKRKAFTLAEVVIVMGILGVMMVAFAPVISKRTTSSAAAFKNFRPMGTHNGVYFGSSDDDKTVLIGGNYMDANYSLNPKLMLINKVEKVNAGIGSFVAIPAWDPSGGFPSISLANIAAHPQLAFATQIGDNRVSMGQLLLTQTGGDNDIGSLILGGKVDEPYRYTILKNITILGALACANDEDLKSGNLSWIDSSVCIGANAGIPDEDDSILDGISSDNVSQAKSWALADVNAQFATNYNSYDAIPAYMISQRSFARQRLAMYIIKFAEDVNSNNSNDWAVYEQRRRPNLRGEGGENRIFIGNKNKKYNADQIFFGANTLNEIVYNALADPYVFAPLIQRHLEAVINLNNSYLLLHKDNSDNPRVSFHFHERWALHNHDSSAAQDALMWTLSGPGVDKSDKKIYYWDGKNSTEMMPWGGKIRSDRRLKNVGELFKGGLEQISKLQIFNYTYKNDEKKTPHIGVMAQDLQEVFPDAVKENEEGFLYIRTEDMFYAGLNAIKELYEKVLDHETRIQQLEAENAELRQMYMELAKRVDKLDGGASAKAVKRMEKARQRAAKRGNKTQEEINKTVEELTAPVVTK